MECHKLWEYSSLVSRVKENLAAGMTQGYAVEELRAAAKAVNMDAFRDRMDEAVTEDIARTGR